MTTHSLLHCDGANGSTLFADTSAYRRSCAVLGNAQVSTAQSKFGGASMLLDGSACVILGSPPQLRGDFCVEAWARLTGSATGWRCLFGLNDSTVGANVYLRQAGGTNQLQYYQNGTVITHPNVPLTDVWHHVALTRVNGAVKLYLDGVGSATAVRADVWIKQVSVGASAWSAGVSEGLIGNVDEVRLTVGHSPYTADFTPDASPFADIPERSVRRLAPIASRLLSSAPPAFSTRRVAPTVALRRYYDGGFGRISGTVEERANPTDRPLSRRVRLFHEVSGRFVAETWSDAAGAYAFEGLDLTQRYSVVAYDYAANYRAVIADNIQPEQMA